MREREDDTPILWLILAYLLQTAWMNKIGSLL
jgi:hypothetical protein